MPKSIFTLAFCAFSLFFCAEAFSQTPTPTPEPDDAEVVRISTSLVQIDAVVTDKNGSPVTNLTADDFELLQDGKPQKITGISYVSGEIPAPPAGAKTEKNAPPAPPLRRSPAGGRLVTFVVDDGNCYASQLGMRAAREALEKFINEQMQSNDRAAIYQTRTGSSMLQQFTSDKAQLLRIARRIRWQPPRGLCGNDATGDFFDPARTSGTGRTSGQGSFENENDRANRNKIDNRLQQNQVIGLVGVLRYIARGLQKMPGRKTVFLLSDGLPLFETEAEMRGSTNSPAAVLKAGDARGVFLDLIDAANRASIVFNTIDVRGVLPPDGGISSQDSFEGMGGRSGNINATSAAGARRAAFISNSQSGLSYLANETGGRFYDDSNDLSVPVRRALSLEQGYYLIAYQPDENTFKGKNFNRIEIKVKRPELSARSRSGFFGVTTESLQPGKRTGDAELYEAIVAPLPNAGLDLRMTAFFVNSPAGSNFVRALLHVGGDQINFTDEPNGLKKAVFDVVAVTLNEKSEVVDEFNRTHTLRFPASNLEDIRRNGLVYSADVPVKKAGAYNFRIAVRDAGSKLLGSAGQQIEVPDLKKNDLYLSELIIGEVVLADGKPVLPKTEKSDGAFAAPPSASVPAIRRFRPGTVLGYSYKIYNAKIEKAGGQPRLTVQVRLFREGQPATEGEPQPAQLEAQSDPVRLADYGYLRLPPNAQTGEYALQLVVKDLQTGKTATQWIDFELVN